MFAHTQPVEHAVIVVVAASAVAWYGVGWLRTPHRRYPPLVAWAGGVATVAVATSPALERYAAQSFTGHMVQHLLLIVVAAPLLVVARPLRAVMLAVPHFVAHPGTRPVTRLGAGSEGAARFRSVRRLAREVRRGWRRRAGVLAAVAFVSTLVLTHLTVVYDLALRNRVVHDVEHVAYLASAVALWATATAAGRSGGAGRVAMVFAVIAGSAFVGVVLLSARAPLVPTYADRLGTAAALDDQRAAASLMWVGGMAVTLPLLFTAVWRWAAAEERVAEQLEEYEHAGLRRATRPADETTPMPPR